MVQAKWLSDEAHELCDRGRNAFHTGNTLEALSYFEKALKIDSDSPKLQSYYGLCIAYERGQIKEALTVCKRAVRMGQQDAETFLNLARVYVKAGQKPQAIDALRDGLKIDEKNPGIIHELQVMGMRKKPVLSFLSRDNVLNKCLGFIFYKLGFR